jgi:hypothetical protein
MVAVGVATCSPAGQIARLTELVDVLRVAEAIKSKAPGLFSRALSVHLHRGHKVLQPYTDTT